MSQRVDLTGQRFGTLTVVGMLGVNTFNQSRCLVECDCGVKTIMLAHNLRRGAKTCGGSAHRSKNFVDGVPLREWCRRHGVSYATIRSRLQVGKTMEEATTTPIRKYEADHG